jgi:uncharacterized membrane protein YkvA (DUF1232 family)
MIQRRNSNSANRTGRRNLWSFKQEIFVLYFAIKDDRTPFLAKFFAFFSLAYLISPIDLIPDFIPVVGYLDDLVIVPLLLHIAFRLLPADVKASCWEKARMHIRKLQIVFIILLILIASFLAGIFFLLRSFFHHL